MRRQRKAKIVATLGPASSSPEMIRALFEAGADVFRLNFSHGTHEDHQRAIDIDPRSSSSEIGPPDRRAGRPAGPQAAGRHLRRRAASRCGPAQPFRLDLDADAPGDAHARRRCRIRRSSQALEPGVELLLDDGKLRLRGRSVRRRTSPRRAWSSAGALSDRKGVNVLGRRAAALGADRQGPRAISTSRSTSASTGSRCRSCSGRRTSTRRGAGRRPRRDHGQAGEAAAIDCLDDIVALIRRGHGGARRSRRGDAAREGARRSRSASCAPAAGWASR